MSEPGNKMVAAAYVAAMNAGAADRVRMLFADDVTVPEVDATTQRDILSIAAEDNEVALLLKETGQGSQRIAMEWLQFDGGKIRKRWAARDNGNQEW